MDKIMARGENPEDISQNDDDTFNVTYKTSETLKNNPDAEVCRNEHIFPDPSARTMKDCRFIIHRKNMTKMNIVRYIVKAIFLPKNMRFLFQHDTINYFGIN